MKNYFIVLLAIVCFKNLAAQDYLIPYRKGNLWGYANEEAKIIIEPKYSAVEPFKNSKLTKIYNFINDTTYVGFASLAGNIAIAPNKYIEIGTLKDVNYRNNYDGDYYGEYNAYDAFLEKYFLGAKSSKINELLDSNGKVLLQNFEKLEIINKYQEGNFNILFRKNNKYGVMDYRGKMLLEPIYDHMYIDLGNKYNPLLTIKNKGKIGLYSKDGKPIIPLALQYIYLDRYRNLYQKVILVQKNNYYSIYNTAGKLLYGPTKKEIEIESKYEDGKEKLVFSTRNESTQSEVITYAEVVAPPKDQSKAPERDFDVEIKNDASYPQVLKDFGTLNIDNKSVSIFKKNNLFGIRDLNDTNVVFVKPKYGAMDIEYDNLTYKKLNIIKVRLGKKYGLIDYTGKILVPIKYQNLYKVYSKWNIKDPILFTATNDKAETGLITANNKIIFPFKYYQIQKSDYHQNDSVFYVKNTEGKKGYRKLNLEYAIPEEYSFLEPIDLGNLTIENKNEFHFLAKNKMDKFGIIDLNNNIKLDFKYDSLVYNNFFSSEKYYKDLSYFYFVDYSKGQYAMFDGKGNTIIPFTNEKISYLLNNSISQPEYYYTTTKTDKLGKENTALYSNKNGLLLDYNTYDYFNMKYYSNYAKGIVYFKDDKNKIGIVLNNKIKKNVPPKYNSIEQDYYINNSTLRKKSTIKYYGLQYQNARYSFSDFMDSNGLLFFED